MERNAKLRRGITGDAPESWRIRLRHIGKPWPQQVIVRANQWIGALEVDVIRNKNKRAACICRIDAAGGVSERQALDT